MLEKLVTKRDISVGEFERIGRLYGVDIEVEEHDQTMRRCHHAGLDTTNGKWRFVWWITIPTSADVERLDTVSTVKTAFKTVGRNSELECRLREASPAHTHLVLGYNAVPALPALADRDPCPWRFGGAAPGQRRGYSGECTAWRTCPRG